MKLKTEHTYKFGQSNIVPYLGLIHISEEGIVEISEQDETKALALVETEIGFSVVLEEEAVIVDTLNPDDKEDEDLKKKSEDDDLGGKSEESDLEHQTEGDSLNKIKNEADQLDSASNFTDSFEGKDVKDVHVEDTNDDQEGSLFNKEEKEVLLTVIEGKTYQETRDYATEMNFPEEEWVQKVNGPQMKKYLFEKIQAL